MRVDGDEYRAAYLPAESDSGMFGSNSNWRGATGKDYETNFGDFTLVPRVILSETQNAAPGVEVLRQKLQLGARGGRRGWRGKVIGQRSITR